MKMKQSEVIEMVEQVQNEARNLLTSRLTRKYGPAVDIFAEDMADYIFGHGSGQIQGVINMVSNFNKD
jgi:precorrin-6B methylase 2